MFNQQLRTLGTMRVVTDRGLEVGDQVVMDLDAVNADTGEAIEGIKQKKFELDTGAARLNLPGLIDGIVGMKVGDEREFPLTMPSDWPQEFIRGEGQTNKSTHPTREVSKTAPPRLLKSLLINSSSFRRGLSPPTRLTTAHATCQ